MLDHCMNFTTENTMELLEFALCTTYFSHNGEVFKQIQGAQIGCTVSVVVLNLYMEDHEETAIATALLEMKPKIWRNIWTIYLSS